jgi:outer membrane biosynthesis protein TonB
MQEHDKKDRNRALATTLSVHTVLLIFFFFYGLTYQDPPPEYGIPVSFGNSLDGAGDDAAAPEGSQAQSAAAAESAESEVVTQELVDAPSVSSEKSKAKEDKKSEVKPEAKPVAEAPKASKELSNRLNSKFGRTGGTAGATGSGQGSTSGGGDQGAPNGSGNGTGGSGNSGNYQLGTRSALERPKPRYDCEGEGIVVVKVYVDRSGTVTRADGQGQKGSTTSEECLIRRAQEAALKTRWQGDPSALELQVGSIRYSFQRN